MKLIDIQRHFFRIKGDENVYFCTEAETRTDLKFYIMLKLRQAKPTMR